MLVEIWKAAAQTFLPFEGVTLELSQTNVVGEIRILLNVSEKAIALKISSVVTYSPFSHCDFYTDLSYRLVATTVCGVLFLLSVQGIVYARGEKTLASVFDVLGDSCSCSVHPPVHSSAAVELAEVQWTAQSDYVSKFASLSNYDNPPTSLFLTLCGDIEENPGPSMDETVSKFEKITSKLEEKLASEIQEMARSLNTTTHQVELLTQRLRDTEKDMLDIKKRSSDRERKIEELTLELDRQQIFSRRDNVVFYGIPEVQDGAEDCVRALAELINSHSYSERVWSEDDFDRAHRLGRASSTKTRPVIAKLHRSRDKRALIANKSLTKDLAKVGVRLSDDHTTKQRTVLKELRRQGLTAYFRGARLISRPGPKSDTRHQAAPEDLDTLQRSSDEEHQSSATLPDAVHRLCDGPTKDQRSSGHRPTDHHSPDHRSPDHRSTDHHSTDRRSTDCQSPGHRSFDHHSQDHRSTDHRSTDHRSPDHRSTDPRSTDHRPTDHRSPDHSPTDPRSTDPRPTDHHSDHRSTDHRSTDPSPTDHHSTDHRLTDRRFPDHRSPTRHSTGRHSPDQNRSSGHHHTSSPPSASSDGPGGGTPPSGREVMNAARPRGSSRRSRSQGRSLDSPTAGRYASTSRPGAGGTRGTERPPYTDRQTRQSASGNSRQTASGQQKQRQRRIDTLLTGKRQ